MTFRRRYSRFRPENPAVTIATEAGLEVAAEIENESYGGMGLTCPDPTGLSEGQVVTIHLEEASYEAVIVSLRRRGDEHQIGLKWIEDEAEGDDFAEDEE
jgi:hypothetical protein